MSHSCETPAIVLGTFHARFTRDYEALQRDGAVIIDHHTTSLTARDQQHPILEVLFADGEWMLADQRDIDFA